MKPAPFRYFAPESAEAALELLQEHGWDAKLLAGGQSLIPAMNFRLAQPAVLVDINRLHELAYVEAAEDGGLRIGAMTRHSALESHPAVAERAPLLHEAVPWIAHPQIRSRGTVGGSLAHADPAAELPAVMLALDASFRLRGAAGERTVPASEFFVALLTTALEPGELLVEVQIPASPPRTGVAFEEMSRRHGDYALVGAAATVTLDAAGAVADAVLTLLSVGDGPVRVEGAARALRGEAPEEGPIDAAAAEAQREVDPPADIHASSDFRRHLVGVLARRALARAARRAQESVS